MRRLAIISTHPIQYNSPFFAELAKSTEIKVFYTWEKGSEEFDIDFGKKFSWDIPLLQGYSYCFVGNNGNQGKTFLQVRNPGIIKTIELWNPDGILVYGWNYWSHVKCIFSFSNKIKVYFRGDSTTLTSESKLYSFIKKFFLVFLFSKIDKAFYVGAENKKYFIKYGLKNAQLFFVPHAVDNNFFIETTWGSEQIEILRSKFSIHSNCVTFIYTGKFIPRKNLHYLVNCFKKIKGDNFRLVLIGSGIEEDSLRKESESDSRIHYLPFQNQKSMSYIYRLGDIFVMPSIIDTWGLSINEAMASGLAILSSLKVGAISDLVIEGVNGFSFNPFDESDLINKMEMISDKSNLENYKKASLEIIKKWSFQDSTKALISSL